MSRNMAQAFMTGRINNQLGIVVSFLKILYAFSIDFLNHIFNNFGFNVQWIS